MQAGHPLYCPVAADYLLHDVRQCRVNMFGVTASAVDSIGNKLNSIVNIVVGAVSVSSATMIGQCFGAKKTGSHQALLSGLPCHLHDLLRHSLRHLSAVPQADFHSVQLRSGCHCHVPQYMVIAAVWVLSVCTMTAPYSVVDGVGNAMLGLVILRAGRCGCPNRSLHPSWRYHGPVRLLAGQCAGGFVTTIMAGVYYYSGAWKKSVIFCSNGTELRSKSPKYTNPCSRFGAGLFPFTCSRAWRWFLPHERRMRQPEQGRG